MLTDEEIILKYGQPGDPTKLTIIKLPYPMRIAWDITQSVTRIQCHQLIADQLLAVFNDLLAHYGYAELQRLGIDLFGGCVNVRPKRGMEAKYAKAIKAGDSKTAYACLSRHAWGIPIDLDPARNAWKTKWVNAQFSKPEYVFMVDTFYKHGFFSYGKDRNFDAMHFEAAI